MKKDAFGIVIILIGLGIVTTSGLITLPTIGDPSIGNEDNNEDNNPVLLDKPSVGEGKEDPDKEKKKEIQATIIINPGKLNVKSNGRWITAIIGLPSSHNVEDIEISTILLTTSLDQIETSETFPNEIVDFDGDNNPELMIKFLRAAFIAILEPQEFCEILITGKLCDGYKFKGGCSIELIHFS